MTNWIYSLYSDRISKKLHFPYNNDDNLIVCRQIDNTRQFTMFKSYTYFQRYQKDIPEDKRCFYEVILGKKSRKPYFDIDIDTVHYSDMNEEKANNMIEILIENIKDYLYIYSPKILVFTSHRSTKLSYHIIVDGVCFSNNEDSKHFSDKVLSVQMKDFVDGNVYSSVQQMRIVGSTKQGKDNKKVLDFTLSDNFFIPDDIKTNYFKRENYILQSSLITFTQNCKEHKFDDMKKKKRKITVRGNASEEDVIQAMKILNKKYSNFSVRQVIEDKGNILVELISEDSYFCRIHKRSHENENAYITIQGIFRNIWFDCRRIESHEKKLAPELIGSLGIPKLKPPSPETYKFIVEN